MEQSIYLILENGTVFTGKAFGATGEVTGEVVFTTSMTGYLLSLIHIYHAIPMNAIGFFGLHIITAGSYDGTEILVTDKPACYKKLFVRDNKLVGFILIGDIARAGIYTSLVRSQTPLDTIDFELICEKPQLMAFSRAYRAEKLGGKKE